MKRKVVAIFILMSMLIVPSVSAGFFDWFKRNIQTNQAEDTDVAITVGNTAPVIVSVQAISPIVVFPASTTNVIFNFTARDDNGANTLDNTMAQARFTKAGEPTRGTGNNCIPAVDTSSTTRIYQCTVPMQFFDAQGLWNINVSVKDNSGTYVENIATTFTYPLLSDINLTVSNPSIAFPNVAAGATNIRSSINTTITNRGNHVVPADGFIRITAHNLTGPTNPTTEQIPADNFKASNNSATTNPCTSSGVTTLDDTSPQNINGIMLARGATGNTAVIQYCITLVPTGLSSQAYSTSGPGSQRWTIGI